MQKTLKEITTEFKNKFEEMALSLMKKNLINNQKGITKKIG